MATTGVEIYRVYQNSIDHAYSNYTSPPQANRWLKQSYEKVLQTIYLERLNNQNAFDELSYLIALNVTKPVSLTNQVYHAPIPIINLTTIVGVNTVVSVTTEFPHNVIAGEDVILNGVQGSGTLPASVNGLTYTVTFASGQLIQFTILGVVTGVWINGTGTVTTFDMFSNYLHLLFANVIFNSPYYNLSITGSTNSLPIRITENKRNTLRDGDYIEIAGIGGNTNANGRHYYKYLNAKLGSLYNDVNFQSPVNGNGTQTGTGTINQIIISPVKTLLSEQKGAIYSQATTLVPRIQQGELSFTVYPLTTRCESMTADYIKKPPVEIDATNNNYDFERDFPYYFLVKIAEEAGRLFSGSARDGNLNAALTEQVLENP